MTLEQLDKLEDGTEVFVTEKGDWGFTAVFHGITEVHESRSRFALDDLMDMKRFVRKMKTEVRKVHKAKIEYVDDFGRRQIEYINPKRIRYARRKGD